MNTIVTLFDRSYVHTFIRSLVFIDIHPLISTTTVMSQASLEPASDTLMASVSPIDAEASSANNSALSGSVVKRTGEPPLSPRPRRRALDDLQGFSYEPDGQSSDPLDSWPERVEVKPQRRSIILSSLSRGHQPRRSFFGDKTSRDDSESAASEKDEASNTLDNARRLSKTAASALTRKVSWKQKRSTSWSELENSRACTFILDMLTLSWYGACPD